jgi:hypothetical protein
MSCTITSLYPLKTASGGSSNLFTGHFSVLLILRLGFLSFGFLGFCPSRLRRSFSEDVFPSLLLLLFPLMSGFPCSPFKRLISSLSDCIYAFNFLFSENMNSTKLNNAVTVACNKGSVILDICGLIVSRSFDIFSVVILFKFNIEF